MQEYLTRLAQLADDVMNCSAVLNWLEVSTELCDWLLNNGATRNQSDTSRDLAYSNFPAFNACSLVFRT